MSYFISMTQTAEIFTARSGQPSARIRDEDGAVRHVHSTVRPEDEARYFPPPERYGNILLLEGTGLGHHLASILKSAGPEVTIVAVEYFTELLGHCASHALAVLPNTVLTLSGASTDEEIAAVEKRLAAAGGTTVTTVRHPVTASYHRDFYDRVLSRISAACLRPRTPEARRFPKILLLHGGFFLQNEIRDAVAAVTAEPPALFPYERFAAGAAYEQAVRSAIDDARPDLVLSVNMKGFDGDGALAGMCGRSGIPAVVWFVDDPHPILLPHRQFISASMKALTWERAYIPYLKECGFGSAQWLPLAADPALFPAVRPDTTEAPAVGFVGMSMAGRFLADIRRRFLWDDALAPLVERASDLLLRQPGADPAELIRSAAAETRSRPLFTDEHNAVWLRSYVIHYASMKRRREAVSALARLGVETYGDPDGWRESVGAAVKTHPDVGYGAPLARLYGSIAVNLNVTSCQMPSAVNQRVFDVPLSGGFVLTDRQADMNELFEPGTECATWGTIDELKAMTVEYAANPRQRARIAEAAGRRVRHEHTYERRMERLFALTR